MVIFKFFFCMTRGYPHGGSYGSLVNGSWSSGDPPEVDTEAADFEANLTSLQQHMQRLNLCREDSGGTAELQWLGMFGEDLQGCILGVFFF